jgi:hypothetical protein
MMGRANKMSEFLDFEMIAQLPKTKIFGVFSRGNHSSLGKIKWYGPWRHYCFFPAIPEPGTEIIHSDRCLMAISQFITKLNEEHKNGK